MTSRLPALHPWSQGTELAPCLGRLTVISQDQRRGWPQDLVVRHCIGDHTGVIPHVGLFYFGDVQVPSLLRDEASAILVGRRLVEEPGVAQI